MNPWYLAAGFILVFVARSVGRRWFVRRWIANGMTPTRAALLSIAVTQLPVIIGFVAFASITGSMDLPEIGFLIGLFLLPSVLWFGLHRAVFDYMDGYGVKDELRRQQRSAGEDSDGNV